MNTPSPQVPFFRVGLSEDEIAEVADSLRSGWLTTGPKVKLFEERFAASVGAKYAVALNSCTAALHLALEAIGVKRGDMVLVPSMTFAATAEVVRYFDAVPVFVDCDKNLCLSPEALESTIKSLLAGKAVAGLQPPFGALKAVIPMHYGGYCCDMKAIGEIADRYGLVVIEDAAHAFPSFYRPDSTTPWTAAGHFGKVGCYSFYANKCITTGEGGMAVTDDADIAARMRLMSLHGMNRDAWKRFTSEGSWFYEIVAPGYKYNLTDIAAAIGLVQLKKAEILRARREEIATRYNTAFSKMVKVEIPPSDPATRQHSWHLYCLRLNLDKLTINRDEFIERLKQSGVTCSVHWYPLHLNPYYRETYATGPGLFAESERQWPRLVSLPLFPMMTEEEIEHVISAVISVATDAAKG